MCSIKYGHTSSVRIRPLYDDARHRCLDLLVRTLVILRRPQKRRSSYFWITHGGDFAEEKLLAQFSVSAISVIWVFLILLPVFADLILSY
jgi:hypothetical protein